MANLFKKDNNKNDPAKPESRAAARARAEAEKREKAEWIAKRKQEEKAAAEAEAKEKAEWIAKRKQEEKAAAEAEAKAKAEWIAQRKREEKAAEEARLEEQRRWDEEVARREKEAKEAEKKLRAQKRAAVGKKILRGVKTVAFILMILIILTGGIWLLLSRSLSKSDKILPNVYLDGIAVGGLTKEETQEKLIEEGWGDPETRVLRVELPMGVSFELDREDAGLVLSAEQAAEIAFGYGRSADEIDNVSNYVGSNFANTEFVSTRGQLDREYVREKAAAAVEEFRKVTSGDSYVVDMEAQELRFIKGAGQMDIDLDKLCAEVETAMVGTETLLTYDQIEGEITPPDFEELYNEVYLEPVNAHFTLPDFDVEPETPGRTFDVVLARELWEKAELMEEIVVPMETLEAEITADQLSGDLFRDCLGSQTTSYGGSTRARVNNINLAVDIINGVVLLPGETFSYNGVVGERTAGRGFQAAPAYVSGQVEDQIGGGICQVSSTLYCASLYARMTIVDRTSHYFRVTYLPPGQDATVSWDWPDFQFRNDREYPVKIVAWCDNNSMQLTIQIWGTDTDGIWVSLSYEMYAVHDREYPEVVVGSNVYLTISYYDAQGHFLYSEQGSASTYHRHDYEIDWPPEKFKDENDDDDDEGGGGTGQVIIDDGGGNGGGDNGGGEVVVGGDEGGEP